MVFSRSRLLTLIPLLFVLGSGLLAQANWKLAQRYRNEFLRSYSYSTRISPQWIGDSERFWYRFKTSSGTRYWLVDPEARRKTPLFDHEALASALSEALRIPQEAHKLELQRLELDESGERMSFRVQNKDFHFDRTRSTLRKGKAKGGKLRKPKPVVDSIGTSISSFLKKARDWKPKSTKKPQLGVSPDGEISVFTKGWNLYVVKKPDPAKKAHPAAEKKGEAKAEAMKGSEESKEKAESTVEKKEGGKEKKNEESGKGLRKKRKSGEASIRDKARKGSEGGKGKSVSRSSGTRLSGLMDSLGLSFFDGKSNGARLSRETTETTAKAKSASKLQVSESKAPASKRRRRRTPRQWRLNEKLARQLTKNGEEGFYFGRNSSEGKRALRASWNPDSSAFYVTRADNRGVHELFLVDSLGKPRPKLKTYSYAMPGENRIRLRELHVYHRETGKLVKVEPAWKDESYLDMRWIKGELRVLRRDRLRRNVQYGRVDPKSGKFDVLFEEGFEQAYFEVQPIRYLEKSGRFLWWSERSGWGHFYLHDFDGRCLGAVTRGAFRAARILGVDEERDLLWFTANGREKGENPFNEHLYRVRLDGSDLRLLNPGNDFHSVRLSKSKRYFVDTASRVDHEPRFCVRSGDGHEVMELESCDLSRLEALGWKRPETFTVKAADGVTDLFGNLWKPFDFDPKKRYPIIVNVYPGPQKEGVSRTFSATSSRQELAQLGFIVIQVGHRGGSPKRSKAYASYGYFNLRDYGLEDKKAAIEELAARHPWIDAERVGIYGHSGGGFMTAAALLQQPYNDFFKVGVSSAGNHDNNIYNHSWSERYHGLREEKKGNFSIDIPTNAELAGNLKGRLLLVHGEIDDNVHPAGTMRLVDALIKARKRFDLLIIPGARHGFGVARDYFTQRMYEYFSQHLLGDRLEGADIRLKSPERR